MDPRQPPQHPFSQRNSGASPLFTRNPTFPPSTSAQQPPFPPTSHPAPPPNDRTYQVEHGQQRRPSDPHYFSQPRAYEPTSHPASAGHSRHPSTSSLPSAPSSLGRPMPPPNSPPQQSHGAGPHQMPYPLPPPRPVGQSSAFANGRELPALGSIARTGSANSSMSISSMLGGPAPSREPAPGPPSQYAPPSTSSGMSGQNYAPAHHASPRMHHMNPGDYPPYRRPQTPDHQRPYDVRADPRDHRGSAAASPQGMHPTPDVQRYGTPQGYGQRGPPMPAGDYGREPSRMQQQVPPRPSSQPKSFPGIPQGGRPLEHGRPGLQHEPMYGRRDEPPPSGEYNPERPIRVPKYEEPRYMTERERMDRDREREMEYRERQERDRQEVEYRERERRDAERREMERREMERREVERRERGMPPGGEPGRPPPGHGGPDYGHPNARGPLPPGYGRHPDPRDQGPWPRQQPPQHYEPGRPYDPAAHPPPPPPRHPDYPHSTAPPFGSHPAPYHPQHQPPDRYPPPSHPGQAPMPGSGPGDRGPPPPHPQPFDSPERQRHILHQHHQQQHPQQQPQHPHRNPADEPPPRPSVAYSGGPGGPGVGPPYDPSRNMVSAEEIPPPHREPPRGLLAIQEMNRKGRVSPLPQAVQGAQPQLPGPASEPGIKSEFGRMFSGIGSGVGALSSPIPSGAQVPFTTAGLMRKDDSEGPGHEGMVDNTSGVAKLTREASRNKRRSKVKEEEARVEDDGSGRLTPVGRVKRAKTHNHAHHHHHHHHQAHHHHHTHLPAEQFAALGNTPFKNVKGAAAVPSPTPIRAVHHHHHAPPRTSAPTSTPKQPAATTAPPSPAVILLPKPKQIISSVAVIASVADKPRQHIGDVLYEVSLEPARVHDPVTGRPPKMPFKSTPKPLPMALIKGRENCTVTVKISKAHLNSMAREEITSRRALWGTDVYTDDSDVIAACIHGGWFRGEWPEDVNVDMLGLYPEEPSRPSGPNGKGPGSRKAAQHPHMTSEALPTPDALTEPLKTGPVNVPPDKDLHVTVLVLPKLQHYASTVRYGIKSREWGNANRVRGSSMTADDYSHNPKLTASHDGLSFKVLGIRWVTNGAGAQSRIRGAARRERMSRALCEVSLGTGAGLNLGGFSGPAGGDQAQRAAGAKAVAELKASLGKDQEAVANGHIDGDSGHAPATPQVPAADEGNKENQPAVADVSMADDSQDSKLVGVTAAVVEEKPPTMEVESGAAKKAPEAEAAISDADTSASAASAAKEAAPAPMGSPAAESKEAKAPEDVPMAEACEPGAPSAPVEAKV
ncbi:hypothetical protein RB600_005776 [Gaeumannomyces tritici]